jgi:hypothetical protein
MRDGTMIKIFESQERDNRFFNASLITIAEKQQAIENILGRWGMLPLLLICSVIYPSIVGKVFTKEWDKIRKNHNG